ncbi:hypothetical protein J008_04158 [Cryptococcus neoformans]|nr:hypothetical protein C362_05125 [Cryptococcus neoformans var. grubii Bt1]OXH29976.1 hypothetical protein J008_04158 [Cryptococcus neoformans var. grubii]
MAGSETSSPTDFAFEPPALPSGDAAFTCTPYKPEPLKPTFASPTGLSPPTGSFTPAANAAPGHSYFPDSYNYGVSSASSFSSASASATGGSFSSVDNLPGISKNFVRPNLADTRRPATAGGALQSRSPYSNFMMSSKNGMSGSMSQDAQKLGERGDMRRPEGTIEEGNEMLGLGGSTEEDGDEQGPQNVSPENENTVNPTLFPANRRSSAPQYNIPGSNWGQFPPSSSHDASNSSLGLPSAPAHMPMGYLQQQQAVHHNLNTQNRPPAFAGRPQTSDGLPSYTNYHGAVTLPSAQSIARQIPGMTDTTSFFHHSSGSAHLPFRDDRHFPSTNFPGDRAFTFDPLRSSLPPSFPGQIRASYAPPPPVPTAGSDSGGSSNNTNSTNDQMQFMSLSTGHGQKKRPRRRYEEIERLYPCGWNGCEKSYGTLNHLNAHVMTQKHGEKRLPAEFKEMRKAWRKKKREHASAQASSQYMTNAAAWQQNYQRLSFASTSSAPDSDWDRRESSTSTVSVSTDGRPSFSYPTNYSWGVPPQGMPFQAGMMSVDSRPSTSSSNVSSVSMDGTFISNQPISAPTSVMSMGPPTYLYLSGPPSLPGGVVSRRPSAPQHVPMPPSNPVDGFRPADGDHPTPTMGNPFPTGPSGAGVVAGAGAGAGAAGQAGKALNFSTLTSPMKGSSGDFGSQFAFTR